MNRLILAAALFSAPAELLAQDTRLNATRSYELAWNPYSYMRHGGLTLHGGELALALHLSESAALVGEISAHLRNLGPVRVDVTGFRLGPRITLKSGNRVSWFSQVLLGGVRGAGTIAAGSGSLTASNTGFTLSTSMGVDVGVKPWLSVRILQAHYDVFRSGGEGSDGFRLGAGLVFKFGRSH